MAVISNLIIDGKNTTNHNNSIISNIKVDNQDYNYGNRDIINGLRSAKCDNAVNEPLYDMIIKGNTIQNGNPTPTTPIEVESVGEYDETTGKYKIPVKVSGQNLLTTNIYLNEPLRKINGYTDYIDYKNKKVVRKIGKTRITGDGYWQEYNSIDEYKRYITKALDTLAMPYAYNKVYSNCFKGTNVTGTLNCIKINSGSTMTEFYVDPSEFETLDSFKQWLSNNDVYVEYVLATATEESIDIPTIQTNKGTNIISVDTTLTPSATSVENWRQVGSPNENYSVTFGSGVSVSDGQSQLSSGNTRVRGTDLTIGYTLTDGYTLDKFEINGEQAINNSIITLTQNTNVVFEQSIYYTITFGEGVVVTRDGVSLSSGDKVPNGTNIVIGYTLSEGYQLKEFKVNGVDTENNATITVTGNVEITFVQEEAGSGGGEIVFSRTFSENSPALIGAVSAEISANNMTSSQVAETYGWNIGDTTNITLSTGENIEMRIIGFNHDDKSDGTGKAGITLEMTHCLATQYPYNNSATNAGGYAASLLKTTSLPQIKATLPKDWQDVIVKVDKNYIKGGGSNYTGVPKSSEDLFLLAQIEVFNTDANTNNGSYEGKVYEYWKNKYNDDRVKTFGIGGKAIYWWLRTCYTTTNGFVCVDPIGARYSYGSIEYKGVSFAFCI